MSQRLSAEEARKKEEEKLKNSFSNENKKQNIKIVEKEESIFTKLQLVSRKSKGEQ